MRACLIAVVLLLAGCQTASVTEWFQEKPAATVPGEPAPPPGRTVQRTTEATKLGVEWWSPSPSEAIARVQPLEIPAKGGARFEGMKAFDLRRVLPTTLLWAGLAIAGVGIALLFVPGARRAGIYTALGGGMLVIAAVAFEAYPWLALVLVGVFLLGGVVWFLWATVAGAKLRAAFATVAKGVANAGDTAAPVKAEIKKAAKVAGTETVVKKAVAKATKG